MVFYFRRKTDRVKAVDIDTNELEFYNLAKGYKVELRVNR